MFVCVCAHWMQRVWKRTPREMCNMELVRSSMIRRVIFFFFYFIMYICRTLQRYVASMWYTSKYALMVIRFSSLACYFTHTRIHMCHHITLSTTNERRWTICFLLLLFLRWRAPMFLNTAHKTFKLTEFLFSSSDILRKEERQLLCSVW